MPIVVQGLGRVVRIVPVIDLMWGLVVRGIAGRREEYRPVESTLAGDARPGSIGQAFVERLGLCDAYVADLDAIAGAQPAWQLYRELIDCGLRLWIDAGLADAQRAEALARFADREPGVRGIIAGLESLSGSEALAGLLSRIGHERLIFSLDLKAGQPLTKAPQWREAPVVSIAAEALELGVRRMIVLDLARVGVGEGIGTEPLCQELRAMAAELELTAGGGVRGPDDLARLAAAGCDAALVASALHDGRLGPDHLRCWK